jgi:exodeoxyribonuclease V alpha subunit
VIPRLDALRAEGRVGAFDVHLARGLARAAGEDSESVLAAIALLGHAVAEGDVCLDLRRAADGSGLDAWLESLRASRLVDSGGGQAPLVLDASGRLYLRRLWDHQRRLAAAVLTRANAPAAQLDRAWLEAALARLFPGSRPDDRQRSAARTALLRSLCVISGGPGTGKTTVVARLLALEAERALLAGERAPRALLLAPTGKAAARLEAAVAAAAGRLDCAPAVRAALPARAQTLHRALGLRPDGSARHGREAPLRADAVIVDEASLVDLALMARLADALPPSAKLILLGDRDQLASVEAGAVLADLCGSGDRDGRGDGLAGCVVVLRQSWRYSAQSGIGELARAIQAGDAGTALALLDEPALSDIELCDSGSDLGARALAGYTYTDQAGPEAQLAAFERFRVLCAHARGPRGVEGVGSAIQRALAEAGRVAPNSTGLWEGRPISITRNDAALGLYNGDVALLARAADGGPLRAFFADPAGGEGRWISPSRLPEHATAFAQTVHRSQGSEYDEVALVLPAEPSRVTTRELVYTAVTRARQRVSIHASRRVLRHAIERRSERSSGLAELLWRSGESDHPAR